MPIHGYLKSPFNNVAPKEIDIIGFTHYPIGENEGKLMVVHLENKKLKEAFAEDFTAA